MQSRNIIRKRLNRFRTETPTSATEYYYEVTKGFETFTVLADSNNKNAPIVNTHVFRKEVATYYEGWILDVDSAGNRFLLEGTTAVLQPYVHSWDLDSQFNTSLERLYGQLRSDLDWSVNAFQARQTLRMFSSLSSLTNIAKAVFRQDFRSARGRETHVLNIIRSDMRNVKKGLHPREYASHWLKYQYGWKPFVQDIYSTLDNLLDVKQSTYRAVTGSSRNVRSGLVEAIVSPGEIERKYWTSSQRALIVAAYEIPAGRVSPLANYTSMNPASILWELVPYSFVADWVYDIGGYLRNLETAMLYGSSLRSAYSVVGYKGTTFADRRLNNTSPFYKSTGQSVANAVTTFKSRTPQANLRPFAPTFRPQLGWQRMVSGAALLSNLLGRQAR